MMKRLELSELTPGLLCIFKLEFQSPREGLVEIISVENEIAVNFQILNGKFRHGELSLTTAYKNCFFPLPND